MLQYTLSQKPHILFNRERGHSLQPMQWSHLHNIVLFIVCYYVYGNNYKDDNKIDIININHCILSFNASSKN